jgi:type IV pilus assembly protein PilA
MAMPQGPQPVRKGTPAWVFVLVAIGAGALILPFTLGVLAVYGVRKFVANSKQAEARNSLGQIAKDAAAAYERDTDGSPSAPAGLCASASRQVPASASMIRGLKYQSVPADWTEDASRPHTGFACLGFSLDLPQYYQYGYHAHGTTTPGDGFRATANGDLDGDGILSSFWITGSVGAGGVLSIAPNLEERSPEE